MGSKKVTLKSADGEAFVIDEAVALKSQTIKRMIEDGCPDNGIPLLDVTSKILPKVIEYCKKHVEVAAGRNPDDRATTAEDDLKSWDADFVNVDHATLLDLVRAANYLNIKSLLYLTARSVAERVKGKTSEEIRRMLNIRNERTRGEEDEVGREEQWAFE